MGSTANNRWNQEQQKRNRLADNLLKSRKKKKRATSPKLIGSTPQRRPLGGFYPQREVISAEPPLHPVPQPLTVKIRTVSEEFICGSNL